MGIDNTILTKCFEFQKNKKITQVSYIRGEGLVIILEFASRYQRHIEKSSDVLNKTATATIALVATSGSRAANSTLSARQKN